MHNVYMFLSFFNTLTSVQPATDRCRCGCMNPNMTLSSGNLVRETAEELEELRVIAAPLQEQYRST